MADYIEGMLAGQQFQLNKFALQEAPIKLEQDKLNLKIGEIDFDRRQKMADLLAGKGNEIPAGQDPLTNASAALFRIGEAAAEAGLPEEAAKDFSRGSTILYQQEEAAYKNWQMVDQKAKFATQILGVVKDQATLDQANAYIKMSTGTPSALEGAKYSPELIEALRESATKKRSEAQELLDKARAKREEGLVKSDAALTGLRKAQTDLAEARADNAKKNGGGGIIAKPKNVAAVTDYLVSKSGGAMDTATARVHAREIALDAERRMDEDPNLKQPQAVAAAVLWSKKHGALAGEPVGHNRPGTSGKPLPIPTDIKGFKDQEWYKAPDGPRWYDAETGKLYKAGEGPEDDDDAGGEETEE